MGRNAYKKKARDAQATRNFFAQTPAVTSPAPQIPRPSPSAAASPAMLAPSPRTTLSVLQEYGANHPLLALLNASEPDAATQVESYLTDLGKTLRYQYQMNKETFREATIEAFFCAYSYVDRTSKTPVWGVDTDVVSLIADQVANGDLIGLFTTGSVKSGLLPEEIVITAPIQLTDYDVVGLIIDGLLEHINDGVERSPLREPGQHTVAVSAAKANLPSYLLALIRVTATSRCLRYTTRADQNLWMELRQFRAPKMETIGNLVVPGAVPMTDDELNALVDSVHAMGGDQPASLADKEEPVADKGKGKAKETAGTEDAADHEGQGEGKGKGEDKGEGEKTAGKPKQRKPNPAAAKARLIHRIEDLLKIDYPSIHARREAFTRALEDLKKSDDFHEAKATVAGPSTSTSSPKPKPKPERKRRPSLHHVDYTTLRTTRFQIGTSPGWLGELERMQAMAFRKKKPEDEEEEEAKQSDDTKTKTKGKGKEREVEPEQEVEQQIDTKGKGKGKAKEVEPEPELEQQVDTKGEGKGKAKADDEGEDAGKQDKNKKNKKNKKKNK